MSVGISSLVLLLLLCAVMSPAQKRSGPVSGDKRAALPVRDTKYSAGDEIQPAYNCGGNIGGLVEKGRKAIANLPNEWTYSFRPGRGCLNNVTAQQLHTLAEDRPFLAFCRKGTSTVKFSLWSKFLRVLVRHDCLGKDSVTLLVASLRAEVDCFDYGTTSSGTSRPYLKADVKIREMNGLTLKYGGDTLLEDRLFFAFRDLIEDHLLVFFEDAIGHSLLNIP